MEEFGECVSRQEASEMLKEKNIYEERLCGHIKFSSTVVQLKPLNVITGQCYQPLNVIIFQTSRLLIITK